MLEDIYERIQRGFLCHRNGSYVLALSNLFLKVVFSY